MNDVCDVYKYVEWETGQKLVAVNREKQKKNTHARKYAAEKHEAP